MTYCNDERARITEPTTLHGPAPAAVYVHGGSWISGNYDTGGFLINTIGPALAAQGFVVVSVDYRLGPKARWPDQIVDVKCAIRYLRANATQLNIDPNEIGAWGQSAGGHLVALLGTAGPRAGWDVGAYPDESSKVQAVVDMAGPSDLLTMGNQGDSLARGRDLRQTARPRAAQAAGRGPARRQPGRPTSPPATHRSSSCTRPTTRSSTPSSPRSCPGTSAANGVPHQLLIVDGGGHEFDNPGEQPTEAGITRAVADFFVRTLVPRAHRRQHHGHQPPRRQLAPARPHRHRRLRPPLTVGATAALWKIP